MTAVPPQRSCSSASIHGWSSACFTRTQIMDCSVAGVSCSHLKAAMCAILAELGSAIGLQTPVVRTTMGTFAVFDVAHPPSTSVGAAIRPDSAAARKTTALAMSLCSPAYDGPGRPRGAGPLIDVRPPGTDTATMSESPGSGGRQRASAWSTSDQISRRSLAPRSRSSWECRLAFFSPFGAEF